VDQRTRPDVLPARSAACVALALLALACQDEPGAPLLDVRGGSIPGTDLVAEDTTPTSLPRVDTTGVETLALALATAGGTLKARVHVPPTCSSTSRCPAVALVPDLRVPGTTQYPEEAVKGLAVLTGSVVAVYNPPGMGSGAEQSGGNRDFGGTADQDALKDLLGRLADLPEVESGGMGVVSWGTGLASAAGALSRFGPVNLPFVTWLVDMEGVTNRCYVTQAPYTVSPDGKHINGDGPGPTLSRCDFQWAPREEKFPAGTSSNGKGTDGTPTSYICNPNAFPLLETGRSCGDDAWWNEREARTWLPSLRLHVLRLQFLHDHRQPTRLAARETLRWLVKNSQQKSFQLNDFKKDVSPTGYGEEQLTGAGAWLDLSGIGNGMGTDVYVTGGGFSPVTADELLLAVLPAYVTRMQERAP